MDLDARLAAIENNQSELFQVVEIIRLLIQREQTPKGIMHLKDAAEYVGYASRSGTPIEIVSKVILRHADLSTTQRYLGKVNDSEAIR